MIKVLKKSAKNPLQIWNGFFAVNLQRRILQIRRSLTDNVKSAYMDSWRDGTGGVYFRQR